MNRFSGEIGTPQTGKFAEIDFFLH